MIARIRALRASAIASHDLQLLALCDLALDGDYDARESVLASAPSVDTERRNMTPQEAVCIATGLL